MHEILIVLLVVAGLFGLGALSMLSFEPLFGLGVLLIVAGVTGGAPAALVYHLRLHRVLAPRGALPPRWWLQPNLYHGALSPSERARVLRWFFIGGSGFALALLGCGIVFVSALRFQWTEGAG